MNRRTYAYAVCLISLVAMIVTAPRAVGAILDYQNPLQVKQSASDLDVSSLENFLRELETKMGRREFNLWRSDQNEVRANDNGGMAYLAARDARVNSVRFEARRSLITNGMVTALGLLLFISHAIIVRRESSPFMD